MTYKTRLTIADVERALQNVSRTLLREIIVGEELYQDLLNAQNGQTVLAWTRDLYDKPDTGNATLTVTAATGEIACLPGANLFVGFQVGRDVQITNFTNTGNNKTAEIQSQTADSITVDPTGLVDEIDTNARCRQNPSTEEQDVVTAAINTAAAAHDIYLALTNGTISAADRASLFRDFA